MKAIIDKVMPVGKKRTALDEAQWEEPDEGNALEREMMLQCKGDSFHALPSCP